MGNYRHGKKGSHRPAFFSQPFHSVAFAWQEPEHFKPSQSVPAAAMRCGGSAELGRKAALGGGERLLGQRHRETSSDLHGNSSSTGRNYSKINRWSSPFCKDTLELGLCLWLTYALINPREAAALCEQ